MVTDPKPLPTNTKGPGRDHRQRHIIDTQDQHIGLRIYTDAALYHDDDTGITFATTAYYQEGSQLHATSHSGRRYWSATELELTAIDEALQHCTKGTDRFIHIYTDSQEAIKTLQARSYKTSVQHSIKERCRYLRETSQVSVRIHWTPGHHAQGTGNRMAHEAAGAQLEEDRRHSLMWARPTRTTLTVLPSPSSYRTLSSRGLNMSGGVCCGTLSPVLLLRSLPASLVQPKF